MLAPFGMIQVMDTRVDLRARMESIATPQPPPPPSWEEMAEYINEHSDIYTARYYTEKRTVYTTSSVDRGFFRKPRTRTSTEQVRGEAFAVTNADGEQVCSWYAFEPEISTPDIARWILENISP